MPESHHTQAVGLLRSSLVVSLLAHALLGGGGVWLLRGTHTVKHYEVPVELVAPDTTIARPPPPKPAPIAPHVAPSVPAQPTADDVAIATPPAPKSAPKLDVAKDAALAQSSSLPSSKPKPKPTPPAPDTKTDAKTPVDDDAKPPEEPADPDPEDAAKIAADLTPYTPAGAKLRIVLRIDRMRASPFVKQLEAILAPMPDYQVFMVGTKLTLSDAFDVLMIATPDPGDFRATFLAGKTARDDTVLKKELAGAKGDRVTWEDVAGGTVGHRAKDENYSDEYQDPRVLLLPYPGWILLTQPAHVAKLLAPPDAKTSAKTTKAPMPKWLAHLSDVTDQTGGVATSAGPIMVLGFSDVGPTIDIPMIPTLIAPSRGVLAMSLDQGGFAATGWLSFTDEATAKQFAVDAEAARNEALRGMTVRFILRRAHAYTAVEHLRFKQVGTSVAFFTRFNAADSQAILDAASAWSKDWFEARRFKPAK